MTGGAGDEHVGHSCEVFDEDIIVDGSAECHRKRHLTFAEFARVDDGKHRNRLRLAVGHFDADGAFAGDWCDDADAESGERESDVVFEAFDLGNTDTFGGNDFVECDSRSDSGFDARDRNAVIAQSFHNQFFIFVLLVFVDNFSDRTVDEEFSRGKAETAEFVAHVERRQFFRRGIFEGSGVVVEFGHVDSEFGVEVGWLLRVVDRSSRNCIRSGI